MLKKIYQFLHPRYQSLFLEYKVEMKPRHGHGLPPHARLYDIINAQRAEYAAWMKKIRQYKPQLQSILKADAVQDMFNLREFLFNPISPIPSTFGRSRNLGMSAMTSPSPASL